MAEGYNLAYNNSIYEDLDNDGKAVIVGVDGRRASDACTFTLTDVQIGIPWYPFIHLGGEEQMWDKFLAQGNSSGQGGIRTRDLSIPKPASYH
ncbi:hypothetical protein DPMN_165051 [Dreissena polymorpha]|uniref:Uncharacterized protein n=1 Tax=Dreissena polymorpha TaxID=45954 RepID=A0A9D4IWM7_DREPO|nr:hypothetical protein DPMN_165051 [Dreissena polymorpha]